MAANSLMPRPWRFSTKMTHERARRAGGEWFHATTDLRSYIDRIVAEATQ